MTIKERMDKLKLSRKAILLVMKERGFPASFDTISKAYFGYIVATKTRQRIETVLSEIELSRMERRNLYGR